MGFYSSQLVSWNLLEIVQIVWKPFGLLQNCLDDFWYCLDNLDVAWLDLANQHRTAASLPRLTEDDLEMIIDDFETQANSTISQRCNNKTAKSLEDNSVCDVCRSPHGEDGNELVFCDGCDICVHQHCYGIMTLDDQKWFCRPCQVWPWEFFTTFSHGYFFRKI